MLNDKVYYIGFIIFAKNNRGMFKHKENTAKQVFEEKTFDIPMDRLTPEIINLAYEAGKRKLEFSTQTISHTMGIVQTFLGWYVAADISLIGILAGLVAASAPSTLSLSLTCYGIVFISVVIICFWKGSMYNVTSYGPGSAPADFLTLETVDWLDNYKDKNWVVCKKYQELIRLQDCANRNLRIALRIRKCYRIGVNISLWAAAFACIILFSLAVEAMLV